MKFGILFLMEMATRRFITASTKGIDRFKSRHTPHDNKHHMQQEEEYNCCSN